MLRDFRDPEETLQAVRASAALPRLGGEPPVFRGERMADGGLIEPILFRTAIAEGATHVLVLRSRTAGYRRPALSELGETIALRHDPRLAELLRSRAGVYNRQAAQLADGRAGERDGVHVRQVAVPDHLRVIGRLESNCERVSDAVRQGARAMASVLFDEDIDLCWQPVIYRRTPRRSPASSPSQDARVLQGQAGSAPEATA